MTQFQVPAQSGFHDPTMQPPDGVAVRKTGGLAITALVLSSVSIILCCAPITATLGILLGLIGIVTLGPASAKKGRGMSVIAVLLGIIFLTLSIVAGMWGFRVWIRPIIEGPREALVQGFAGNISGFKSSFFGPGATAPDDEAKAFINDLRTRFGEFQGCRFDDQGGSSARPQPGQPEAPFPYVLDFSNQKSVRATAIMVFADQATGQFVMKWRALIVHDQASSGDLEYPEMSSGSSSGGSTSTPPLPDVGGTSPASSVPASTSPADAPNG